jgi:hypothetical protein
MTPAVVPKAQPTGKATANPGNKISRVGVTLMSDADDINSPREVPSKPRTTIPMRSTASSFAETVMPYIQ